MRIPRAARWLLALGLMSLSFGCAASTNSGASPAPAPLGLARQIRLTDAVTLDKLHGLSDEVVFLNRLRPEQGRRVLYFGHIVAANPVGGAWTQRAIIAFMSSGHWLACAVPDDLLSNPAWVSVSVGPAAGEAWAVLDSSDESASAMLLLAHGAAAGTWSFVQVPKPYRDAEFYDFCMSADGQGRLTMYLDPRVAPLTRVGFYHLRTTDGGNTWSSPQFEPDAMMPAPDVGQDEQPQNKGNATRTVVNLWPRR